MSRHDATLDLVQRSTARLLVVRDAGGPDTSPWNDMRGPIIVHATGAGKPTWTQLGSSVHYAYAFAVNDYINMTFHPNHDIAASTSIFMHAH